MRRSLAIAAAASFALAGTLTACSSDDSANNGEMVGGMTECTDAIVNAAAEQYVESLGSENQWVPDSVQCADGWAVASGVIAAKDAPEDGPQGAPASVIFEQEGQFWIPKQSMDVCGAIDGDTYPSDAQIPEELFLAGCLSG
jgi:roadblock/LC7 domain-containing protein